MNNISEISQLSMQMHAFHSDYLPSQHFGLGVTSGTVQATCIEFKLSDNKRGEIMVMRYRTDIKFSFDKLAPGHTIKIDAGYAITTSEKMTKPHSFADLMKRIEETQTRDTNSMIIRDIVSIGSAMMDGDASGLLWAVLTCTDCKLTADDEGLYRALKNLYSTGNGKLLSDSIIKEQVGRYIPFI